MVMGIGGERIQDMTKGIAYYAGLPAIIISTVASTDPPCSSLSLIYRDNGEFDRYLFLDRCPDGAGRYTCDCKSACQVAGGRKGKRHGNLF